MRNPATCPRAPPASEPRTCPAIDEDEQPGLYATQQVVGDDSLADGLLTDVERHQRQACHQPVGNQERQHRRTGRKSGGYRTKPSHAVQETRRDQDRAQTQPPYHGFGELSAKERAQAAHGPYQAKLGRGHAEVADEQQDEDRGA